VSNTKSGSSKKVATWASLFQTEEENLSLRSSEIGQYSCTKLLRKMENLESETEDEISTLAPGS
jgi:hypothetical protein